MTIQVRPITPEESAVLDHWQRSDNVVGNRRNRILRLSEAGWQCEAIAEVLGLHVGSVQLTIKQFNQGGRLAVTPERRSGGR